MCIIFILTININAVDIVTLVWSFSAHSELMLFWIDFLQTVKKHISAAAPPCREASALNSKHLQVPKCTVEFYRFLKALSHQKAMTQRPRRPSSVPHRVIRQHGRQASTNNRRALFSPQGLAERGGGWGQRGAGGKAKGISISHT